MMMTLTPDEIKMLMANHKSYTYSLDEFMRDALALIQQLEAENKQYHQENTEMYSEMCMLREKVHRLEAERDAAVEDLQMGVCCGTCAYDDTDVNEQPCATCARATTFGNWEWRGVTKEGET